MHNGSEVARLEEEIRSTADAARNGLYGVAQVARHAFITAKMERMGRLHDEIAQKVGDTEADEILIRAMEGMVVQG